MFQPEKQIVVSLGHANVFTLPKPFLSSSTKSPPNSTVKPPDVGRIIFDLPSAKILIQTGIINYDLKVSQLC